MTAAQARDLAERRAKPGNRTVEAIVRHAMEYVGAAAAHGAFNCLVTTKLRMPTRSEDWSEAWRRLAADGYKVGDGPGDKVLVEW